MNKYIHKAKVMTNAELESAVKAIAISTKLLFSKNDVEVSKDNIINHIKENDYYYALFNEYAKRVDNGRIKVDAFNVLR